MSRRKITALALPALLFALCVFTQAQEPQNVYRIVYLGNTAATSAITIKSFRERLNQLGYVEGQNITIEYRYFDGKFERLPEIAIELVNRLTITRNPNGQSIQLISHTPSLQHSIIL